MKRTATDRPIQTKTDRHRDRHRDRQKQTETDKNRQKQTDRQRQTDRQDLETVRSHGPLI